MSALPYSLLWFLVLGVCWLWTRSVKPDDVAEAQGQRVEGDDQPPGQPLNARIDDGCRVIPNDSVTRQGFPAAARRLTATRCDGMMPLCDDL
jgi:hypothetical protein